MSGQKERLDFDNENLSILEEIISTNSLEGTSLMEMMYRVQKKLGYLPKDMQRYLIGEMKHCFDPGYLWRDSLIGFPNYMQGYFHITTCNEHNCFLSRPPGLMPKLCEMLDIAPGTTTEDGAFTIEEVPCTGMCHGSPNFSVNNRLIENMKASQLPGLIRLLRKEYRNKGH